MSFERFNLNPDLLKGIQDAGYTEPTPIQAQTIPLLLDGKDVIGCAQTGTGKTAAFALPILEKLTPKGENPQALILTPTRELADQIFNALQTYSKHLKTRSMAIYGGTSIRFQNHNLKQGTDIIVATPGRLLDHLQKTSIRLFDIEFLILDEADRMLDMGFIPDIEEILSYTPRKRQTLLFSATMPPAIEKLSANMTKNPETITIANRNATAKTVTQWLYPIKRREKNDALLKLINTLDFQSMIIFSGTKIGCDKLSRELNRQGVQSVAIHSNLSQSQRESALNAFKEGFFKVLVATDIAARGLDITGVSHVINYDTPTDPESYVHRIGRTGRADTTGEAFTFTMPSEKRYLQDIEELIGKEIPVYSPKKAKAAPSKKETAKKEATKEEASKEESAKTESTRKKPKQKTTTSKTAASKKAKKTKAKAVAEQKTEAPPEAPPAPQAAVPEPVIDPNQDPILTPPSAIEAENLIPEADQVEAPVPLLPIAKWQDPTFTKEASTPQEKQYMNRPPYIDERDLTPPNPNFLKQKANHYIRQHTGLRESQSNRRNQSQRGGRRYQGKAQRVPYHPDFKQPEAYQKQRPFIFERQEVDYFK